MVQSQPLKEYGSFPIKRTFLVGVFATLFGFVALSSDCGSVRAQEVGPPTPEQLEHFYGRPMRRTVQMLLEEYHPHFSERERSIVDQIDIEVSLNLEQLPFARYQAGKRTIQIGVNLIALVEPVHDAIILTHRMKEDFGRVSDFIDYVSLSGKKAYFDISQGRQPDPFIPFENFSGLDEREVSTIRGDRLYVNMMVQMKIETISYILAHEIAHHTLGHLGKRRTVEETRKQEQEADTYSFVLSAKAGFPLLNAAPSLAVIAEMERLAGTQYDQGTHPPTVCRMYWMTKYGMETLGKDLEFQAYLDANPDHRQAFAAANQQFHDVKSDAESECGP